MDKCSYTIFIHQYVHSKRIQSEHETNTNIYKLNWDLKDGAISHGYCMQRSKQINRNNNEKKNPYRFRDFGRILFKITFYVKCAMCNVHCILYKSYYSTEYIENVKLTKYNKINWICNHIEWRMVLILFIHAILRIAIGIHCMHVLFHFTYSCINCTVQFSDTDQSSWLSHVSHQFVYTNYIR